MGQINPSDISYDKLEQILSRVAEISLDGGTCTSGAVTNLVDSSKDWEAGYWKDATVHVIKGSIEYVRNITNNSGTVLFFSTLGVGNAATSGDVYMIRRHLTRISGELILSHVTSGVVASTVSGSVQISGAVVVSGVVGISGSVSIWSGHVSIQSGQVSVSSGDIRAGITSGVVSIQSGQLAVSSGQISVSSGEIIGKTSGEASLVGVYQPVAPTIASGSIGMPRIGADGRLISNISGEVVVAQVLSGQISVSSGDIRAGITSGLIAIQSGQISISSGQISISSGQVDITSGAFVNISGQYVKADVEVAISSGLEVVLRGTTVSGSVQVSGTVTVASGSIVSVLSGAYVVAGSNITSGSVQVSGAVIISGNVTVLSGSIVSTLSGCFVTAAVPITSGSVIISGNVSIIAGTAVRTRLLLYPTALSGGSLLLSGDVTSVTIKSLSGDVWIGGTAALDYPYSGSGFLLTTSEAISLDVDNFNLVSVCANVSGSWVSYIGVK